MIQVPFILAGFFPKNHNADTQKHRSNSIHANFPSPVFEAHLQDADIYISYTPSFLFNEFHTKDISLILFGEIYNITDKQTEYISSNYYSHGIDFMKELNGSFSIFLVDKAKDIFYIITDRINSRKIFHGKYNRNYWFSSSIYQVPLQSDEINISGLACYLANGVIYNNHTLFNCVNILDRASIHTIRCDKIDSQIYWNYMFSHEYAGRDDRSLKEELSGLLVESVKRRYLKGHHTYLSLSGGYESTGVLGIMNYGLNIRNVECVSYTNGVAPPGSDADVAKKTSAISGYRHTLVNSYNGNIIDTIQNNAALCNGIAPFCYELDAWMALNDNFIQNQPASLFVADECFGWPDLVLNNFDHLRYKLNFAKLSWLQNFLSPEHYAQFKNSLDNEITALFDKIPQAEHFQDVKDYWYSDQRLVHVIQAWREFYTMPFIPVKNSFLDNSILDFYQKTPVKYRISKRLYRETISDMYPELFRVKRANNAGTQVNWDKELVLNTQKIIDRFLSQPSKLDQFISPDVIIQLINAPYRSKSATRSIAEKSLSNLMKKSKSLNNFLRTFPMFQYQGLSRTILLLRIITLREFVNLTTKHPG